MITFVKNISHLFQNKTQKNPYIPEKEKTERRRSTRDRRRSVNDGVIVRLTCRKDRRSGYDRRKRR